MSVSYQQLFADAEPDVITVSMTRDCIELPSDDPEHNAEKRKVMEFDEVVEVAFSFRKLVKIDNLHGLDKLTKLKLDNNRITTIENLSHLTNLTWLDLSFNRITRIEGLETLTQLLDLSLCNNTISDIEGLGTLSKLHVLSLGNNQLNKLDKVLYLRGFRNLQLINLAGNPICREANYRSYLLSHIRSLTYLDYRRVKAEEVQAALEQHQDEMLDLREKEELQDIEEKEHGKQAENNKLLKEANLLGVDTFFDDMTCDDPEWVKLSQVPGLTDGWSEVKDKFQLLKDEFKVQVLDQHETKKAEYASWRTALKSACEQKDKAARKRLTDLDKAKKVMMRTVQADPTQAVSLAPTALTRLVEAKQYLMSLEMEVVEVVEELLQLFDRNYSEMAEHNKLLMMAFFTSVRDMENNFSVSLTTNALKLYDEKYNVENGDASEALSEDARTIMSDKDILLSAIQTSHDLHTAKMDVLEDTLVNNEVNGANALVTHYTQWATQRNRDRIAAIITYIEQNAQEIEALVHDGDDE